MSKNKSQYIQNWQQSTTKAADNRLELHTSAKNCAEK